MKVIKRETTKSKTTKHDLLVLNLQMHYSAAAFSWFMEIIITSKLDNISVTCKSCVSFRCVWRRPDAV